ncbi:hypothetical protein [Rhizobium sp. BK418]|uniref:DUF6894 family protein n=1 Tax=Rhizobium sp. BK418 TaxID=2512120 RepID=UPI00104A9F7C|nr:hypothetical protein [Rhizobium sp. BK418]TCR96309.1 hypothetical protein EV281_11176 [Rhizobium sp. BK418]
MRYFFHMRSHDGDEPDNDGLELASLEIARREAEKSAREMVAELVTRQERIDGTRFEIADDQGRVLATVQFKDVIKLA